jgi:hypothetical protein
MSVVEDPENKMDQTKPPAKMLLEELDGLELF